MEMTAITKDNFDDEVLACKVPVILGICKRDGRCR